MKFENYINNLRDSLEKIDQALKLNIKDMEIAEDIQLIVFHYLKQKLINLFPLEKENYNKYNERVNEGNIAKL